MSQKIDLSVSNEFSGVRIDKFLAENIDFNLSSNCCNEITSTS